MNKKKTFNIIYFSFSLAVIIIFAIVIRTWYNLILDDAKISHQKKQLEMSQVSAIGIQMFFNNIINEMSFLYFTNIFSNRYNDENVIPILNHINEEGILGLYTIEGDAQPRVVFGSAPNFIEVKNITKYNDQEIFITDFFRDTASADKNYFYLCKKINPDIRDNKVLFIKLNLDLILEKYFKPLQLTRKDYAWVLDDEGTLIYHPRHKEMIFENIFESSENCNNCHSSFEVQKNMLINKSGISEYSIADQPLKIMAYSPIKIANRNWFIAISTMLPDVTYNLKSKLSFLIISSILIFSIIIGFVITNYRVNVKRIMAEDERKSLAQEMKYQDELNHISRLASVGELVDTVAHEINTPTGIISIQADTLKLNSKPEENDEIEIIKKQVARISNYTRSLLNYSKRIPFNPQKNSIVSVVEDSFYLLGHRFRSMRTELLKEIEPDLPDFYFDKLQIEQVVINILNNAFDAIKLDGTISVTIKKYHDTPTNLTSSDQIEIRIQNSGDKISPENLDRIFEPFFTSKPEGKGTGLGLSISKKIIQRHEGTIFATNGDNGPTFTIRLPIKNNIL